MKKSDTEILQEAYLSIKKSGVTVPSDKETVDILPNKEVSVGPMDEPAPGVKANMSEPETKMVEPQSEPSVPAAVSMELEEPSGDERMSTEDEDEEDAMALDNLNSIRESIMKIASFCASGEHLESWMQQKLAIAMDNLAGVARSLR